MNPSKEQTLCIENAVAGNDLAISAFAGCGKAQPITCKVQTPKGEISLSDLQIGDPIFRKDGSIGTVIGKFPQGVCPTYKVTFRDGSFTYCNLEHLWNIQVKDNKSIKRHGITYKTMTLQQLLDAGILYSYANNKVIYKYQIPLTAPVKFEEKDLFIHPYLLGLLIGDGYLVGNVPALSIGRNEWGIINKLQDFLPEGCSFSERLTSDICKQLTLHYNKAKNKLK